MKSTLLVVLFGILFVVGTPQAMAQSAEMNIGCSHAKGPYRVYFNAYQSPPGGAYGNFMKKHCEVIPSSGDVLITVDVVRTNSGDIVRDRPVGVRIIEGGPGGEGETMTDIPAEVRTKGLIEIRPNLVNPGSYHMVVTIEGRATDDTTITIPFRVGSISAETKMSIFFILSIVFAIAAVGYYIYLRRGTREVD